MQNYDLLVIGGGAGLSVIDAAMQNGLKCALIERSKLGGTCLTKGCIPSKVLVHPADLKREIEHSSKTGLHVSGINLDWSAVSERVWAKINRSFAIEEDLKQAKLLDLYKGTASFIAQRTIQISDDSGNTKQITADKIIIAAGARTAIPPIQGLDDVGYITAESFFGDKYPDKPWPSLTIIGGGAIGLEFAHIFSAFGTKVNIVEMKDRIAWQEEPEISASLERNFASHGIKVMTGTRAVSVISKQGMKYLLIKTEDGQEHELVSDEIMLASGVRSNSDLLHLELTEIETDERGWIKTNEYLETSQENVWAVGDINGLYQFRHKANYEVEVLVHNLFGGKPKRKANYTAVPWAVFTSLQIAHVGMTEDQARRAGHKVLVGRNPYAATANGYALGYDPGSEDDCFVKMITDENYKILGVHIIGPQASILIQPYVYLMNAGATCKREETDLPHGQMIDGQFVEGSSARMRPGLCLEADSTATIDQAMIIHPALSEVAGWVTGALE
jgi:dihydrolipoamide dehydrogenase